jgi:hypothetical protein
MLAANTLHGSGLGFIIVLVPIVALLGVGAVIGSLWTRGREQKR